jgi:hypothetical protein
LAFFGDRGQQDQRALDCFADDVCHHLPLTRESIIVALMRASFAPDHASQIYSYVLFLNRDISPVGTRDSSPYAWAALSEAVDFTGASLNHGYMRAQLDMLYEQTLHPSPNTALKNDQTDSPISEIRIRVFPREPERVSARNPCVSVGKVYEVGGAADRSNGKIGRFLNILGEVSPSSHREGYGEGLHAPRYDALSRFVLKKRSDLVQRWAQ